MGYKTIRRVSTLYTQYVFLSQSTILFQITLLSLIFIIIKCFMNIYRNITATQNAVVSFLALGEGWHNYHHSFPWDYKSAELGNNQLNFTTWFIDTCALFGLAYNLKTAKSSIVDSKRSRKTGAK